MTSLCCKVLERFAGKTLATAESLTGGGIGAALTAVPGASAVYLGGVISYCDRIKHEILGVPEEILETRGAVSSQTAAEMVCGVRKLLKADAALSVTGLAGPGGDEFGHPVGTVFIGYEDEGGCVVREYHFSGSREDVREQTIRAALMLALEMTE